MESASDLARAKALDMRSLAMFEAALKTELRNAEKITQNIEFKLKLYHDPRVDRSVVQSYASVFSSVVQDERPRLSRGALWP